MFPHPEPSDAERRDRAAARRRQELRRSSAASPHRNRHRFPATRTQVRIALREEFVR